MSRARATHAFGAKHGDALYRRYHSMRSKALNAGVNFHWKSFSEFYDDLMRVAPPNYHPRTHRLRFDLRAEDEHGAPIGYCRRTMGVAPTYQQKSGRINPVARDARLPEEFVSLLCAEIAIRLGENHYTALDAMIEEAFYSAQSMFQKEPDHE